MAITNPSPWHATVLSIFLAGQLSGCSSKVVNLGDNSSPNSQVQVPRDAGMPDYGVLQKDFNIGGIAIEPGHLYWQAATFNPPSMGGTSSTTFLLRSMGLGQDAGSTSSYTLYSIPQIGGYDNNSGQLRIDGDWLYWPSHDYSTNSNGVSRCSKSDCSTSEFLGNIGAVGSLVVQNGTVYWLAPDVSNQVTSLYRCEAANCVATKTQIPMNAPPGAVVYTRSSGLYVDEMFLYTADFGPVVSTGLQVGRILRVPKDGSGPFQVIAPGSWGFLMNEDTVFWEQLSTDEKILSIVSCPKSGCLGQPTTLMATLTLGLNTLNLLSIDSSSIYVTVASLVDSVMYYQLARCPIGGCMNLEYLALSKAPYSNVVSDNQYIYFVNAGLDSWLECSGVISQSQYPDGCTVPLAYVGRITKTW